MTAQTGEIVRLEDQEFTLAGVDGRGLFDPRDHGIMTHAVSSANWRGFVSTYEVSDDRLWLIHLTIGFHGREAPVVFGVKPQHEEGDMPYYGYAGLKRPVDFTGGFLLGRDFVREMYVHMGFHPGYAYRIVKEILFDAGRVLERIDRSDEMAEIREAMLANMGPLTGAGATLAWIRQRFSLRYTARRGNGEPFRESHPTPESDSSGGAFGELNRRMMEGLGEDKTKSEPETG